MESPLSSSGSNPGQLSISTFKLWYWMILEYIGYPPNLRCLFWGFSDSQSGKWIASQLLCHQVDEEVPTSDPNSHLLGVSNNWRCNHSKGEKGDAHPYSLTSSIGRPLTLWFPFKGDTAACSKAGRIGASAKEPICGHGSFYLFGYTSHITFDLNRSE